MIAVVVIFGGALFGFLGGLAGSKAPEGGAKVKTAATAAICTAIICGLGAVLVPVILDALRD